MEKKAKAVASVQDPAPLTSLDDIINLVATPILIKFQVKDKLCQIKARHLKPMEDEILVLQANEIVPPIIRGKTEGEDRLDYTNKDYLNRKTKVERQIRAQGLLWAVEAFQEKLGQTNKEAVAGMYKPEWRDCIVKFVQDLLDDDVLNHIWGQIRTTSISVPAHVNFTSPAG